MFVQNSDGFIRLNLACQKATLAEGLSLQKQLIQNIQKSTLGGNKYFKFGD